MAESIPRPPRPVVNNTYQTFTDATMAGAQWDFQGTTGECQAGKFVANSAETTDTTQLSLSQFNTAGSDAAFMRFVAVGNLLRFTDTNGKSVAFMIISSVIDSAGCMVLGVQFISGTTPWAGRYVIDTIPGT